MLRPELQTSAPTYNAIARRVGHGARRCDAVYNGVSWCGSIMLPCEPRQEPLGSRGMQ